MSRRDALPLHVDALQPTHTHTHTHTHTLQREHLQDGAVLGQTSVCRNVGEYFFPFRVSVSVLGFLC